MNILTINNITKQYSSTLALDNVSFEIERGSVFGILGPNGAGKTTLLRIINNILYPDSGEVLINGEKASLQTSRFLGYMPEERGLYDKMKVEEQIMYFGLLKGGDKARMRRLMKEYMEIFKMTENAGRKIKELSKGNQQKVQIIATLIHEPQIVVLDEPFSGFDPINGALLQDLIARLREQNVTILLSSHNMPAIEEICEQIAILNHGKLLLHGKISDIKEQNREDKLLVTTRTPLNLDLFKDRNIATAIADAETPHHRKGYGYEIIPASNATNMDVLDAIAFQSEIVHFEEKLPSLNDLFLKYTSAQPTTVTNPETSSN